MVCPAISYSFGATALIFCRMSIHIRRYACPQDCDGQAGASWGIPEEMKVLPDEIFFTIPFYLHFLAVWTKRGTFY
jgi:hypothetical protein